MKFVFVLYGLILMMMTSCSANRSVDIERPLYSQASMASTFTDSIPEDVKSGEFYVSEQHGKQQTVSIKGVDDDNPTVGAISIGVNTYNVRKGPRGGLYIWRVSGKTGNAYKQSVTDKRDRIEFYD